MCVYVCELRGRGGEGRGGGNALHQALEVPIPAAVNGLPPVVAKRVHEGHHHLGGRALAPRPLHPLELRALLVKPRNLNLCERERERWLVFIVSMESSERQKEKEREESLVFKKS